MPICTTENIPASHQLGVSALHDYLEAGDATPVSVHSFQFLTDSHVNTAVTIEDDGNNGEIDVPSEGVVESTQAGTGPVTFRPRADDIAVLMPLWCGGVFAGGVLEPDWICQYFTLEADKSVEVYHHRNARTNSVTLSSSYSSPILQAEWNIESTDVETTAATTFTAGLTKSVLQPFVHTSSTITLDGTEYKVDDTQLSINNNLVTDQYFNCPQRTSLPMGRQEITLTTTTPYNTVAQTALRNYGATSITGQVVYTAQAGALSLTFDFPALQASVPTVSTPSGNSPVRLEGVVWKARSTGSGVGKTSAMTVTLDSTP